MLARVALPAHLIFTVLWRTTVVNNVGDFKCSCQINIINTINAFDKVRGHFGGVTLSQWVEKLVGTASCSLQDLVGA